MDTSSLTIAEIHNATHVFPDDPSSHATSFTVLRDPYSRFVSAFLDRVVSANYGQTCVSLARTPAMALVRPDLEPLYQHIQGVEHRDYYGPIHSKIIETLTCENIAQLVALTPDRYIENHFKPQKWFMHTTDFDYLFSMENPGWQSEVENLIGSPLVPQQTHATAGMTLEPGLFPEAAHMTVSELRQLRAETGSLPSAQDFLSPTVRSVISARYKEDVIRVAALQRF